MKIINALHKEKIFENRNILNETNNAFSKYYFNFKNVTFKRISHYRMEKVNMAL